MKALRLLTVLAACCATSTMSVAFGAEPAAAPAPAKPASPEASKPAAAPAAESAAQKGDEDTKDQAEEQVAAKPQVSGADKKGSPERFVPSEQVRADFDVSFPIDI
jgi:hypothetical protein